MMKEIKKRYLESGCTLEEFSRQTGLPLDRLEQLLGNDKETQYGKDFFCENISYQANTKKQGEYTVEDYYALPDDRRAELIDGVFYDMASPSNIHQLIGYRILVQLSGYIDQKKGKCIPFVAPVDVQLDCDDKTIVQPDVILLCNRKKMMKNGILGAPDFLIEILSGSTASRDKTLKLSKYQKAGVREYWIVDPKRKKVIVYNFEQDSAPVIYGFEDKIPVYVLDYDCIIDFASIYDYVRFLYE